MNFMAFSHNVPLLSSSIDFPHKFNGQRLENLPKVILAQTLILSGTIHPNHQINLLHLQSETVLRKKDRELTSIGFGLSFCKCMVPEEFAGDYWQVKKLFFEGMNLGEQDVLLLRSGGWLGRAQQLQLSESFSKLRLKTIKESSASLL